MKTKKIFFLFCTLVFCVAIASCTTKTGANKQDSENANDTSSSLGQSSRETASPSTELASSLDLHTNASITTTHPCHVTEHTDGDTLSVDCLSTRIRMIGIDTPETVNQNKPVQCYGHEASDHTKQLLPIGAIVYIESDASQGDTDKYNRPLRYIYNGDGVNVNMQLILEGYAHEYTYHTAYKYQAQFLKAQTDAKEHLRGFWSPSTCNGDTEKAASGAIATVNPPANTSGSGEATGSHGHEYWYGKNHCVKIPNDGDWYKCTRPDGSTYNHTG